MDNPNRDDQVDELGAEVLAIQPRQEPESPAFEAAWWVASRLFLLLLVILFIVWTGVFTYG